MSLFSVENVSISGHHGMLFENLSFSINEGDRVGLVGNNGCGKSTLLSAIAGEMEVSKGKIQKKKGLKIGYISQSVPKHFENMTLREVLEDALPPQERDYSQYKVDMALEALGAPSDVYNRPMCQLSGGWRRLALIARTNLDDPDVLLLDEPTNHLDVGKIMRLENWLRDTVFIPYLIVSHDRQFLDRCTTKTLIMRGGKVHAIRQSFSQAKEALQQQDVANAHERREKQKKIDKLKQTAKEFKVRGKNFGSEGLSRIAKTIEKRVEQMEELLPDVYKEKERKISLGQNELEYNKVVLRIKNLDICIPNTTNRLFHIKELEISKGDRIVVLGLNGTGKSLLIKALMRAYEEGKKNPFGCSSADPIFFNQQVIVGYVDQELSMLPPEKNLHDFIQERFSLDKTKTIRELVNAGFSINEQNAKIGTLSYGQKARMAFLILKNEQPNFYIMDEPTNHLDIDGQERLESAILKNDNPCVFISHDRQLISNVATKYFLIERGQLRQIQSPELFYTQALSDLDIGIVNSINSNKTKNVSPVSRRDTYERD